MYHNSIISTNNFYYIYIFDWNQHVVGDCFVIALEVIDNFPHDKVVTIKNKFHQTYIVQSGNNI